MKFFVIIEKGFSREYTSPTYPHGYVPAREVEGHIFEVDLKGFGENCADLMEGKQGHSAEEQYKLTLVEVRYGVDHPKYRDMLLVLPADSPSS